MNGRIYLVHAPDVHRFKIGRTTDLVTRLAGLRNGSPVPLKLAYDWPVTDSYAAEQAAHAAFEPYRVDGRREWYAFPFDVNEAVEQLAEVIDRWFVDSCLLRIAERAAASDVTRLRNGIPIGDAA